ncbi:hypothetical protein ACFVMC_00430 [Nocardia sp. NPDC127579]|uniref:hypothetical protein n=1 Tax=Nocardia sp. NPDC127579 TaxID=3345402 RepID=UPI003636FE0A
MPWFKVDDNLAFHGKTIAAGNAAMGLWVRAGSWCSQMLTDGFVPAHMISSLGKPAEAKRLVEAGLWHRVDGGYRFHEWDERQPSKAATEQRRTEAKQRMQRARAAKRGDRDADVRANDHDTGGERSHEPARTFDDRAHNPDPTRPDPKETTTHPERQSHVTSAPENQEQPRGPAIDAQGWKLVRETVPGEHPHATRTDLAIRAGALLHSGTPESDVRQALTLWLDKPKLGPGALPSLVSEVVRNRARPYGPAVDGAATTKARGWLELGAQLDPNPHEQRAIQ